MTARRGLRAMKFSGLLAVAAFAVAAFSLTSAGANAQQAPPITVPGTGSAYRIYADTVSNGLKPGVQGVTCVNQSVFFAGDLIVWRAVIADAATGVELTAADVAQRGLRVAATLPDGTTVPLRLGSHPPPPNVPAHESYWSGSVLIKPDHPTGTLPWTVTVTDNQGRSGTFTPVGQAAGISVLTIAAKGATTVK